MKIIIDDKIPYIQGALEPFAEVVYLPGSKTTAGQVKDADAIITRTRTICNEELLAGSRVKIIASATIGYDHIDTDYCDRAGIAWTNAPGCNSGSVEQYIASALVVMAERKGLRFSESTIGIVGVGNVGTKVARIAQALGMRVLLNDPPRARKEGSHAFVELERILEEADILTLHVPLNMEGEDSTFHLADEAFFSRLGRKPIFVNSCRGEVVDTDALKAAILQGKLRGTVVDCWEHEPEIDLELLSLADLATPHIAGYSRDGKAKGTEMSVRAVGRHLGLQTTQWKAKQVEKAATDEIFLDGSGKDTQQILTEAILATYDIREDDKRLRDSPKTFEKQRGDYPVRREFPYYKLYARVDKIKTIEKLKKIGFQL
ncbi:MAG: 4-phosphoerythronate dehydrogenase PdxB [Marinilabiliales bacterium]|nr:4-phosphoerythronate dehydrogenase PdxB [Marinilabiliales bacterium]